MDTGWESPAWLAELAVIGNPAIQIGGRDMADVLHDLAVSYVDSDMAVPEMPTAPVAIAGRGALDADDHAYFQLAAVSAGAEAQVLAAGVPTGTGKSCVLVDVRYPCGAVTCTGRRGALGGIHDGLLGGIRGVVILSTTAGELFIERLGGGQARVREGCLRGPCCGSFIARHEAVCGETDVVRIQPSIIACIHPVILRRGGVIITGVVETGAPRGRKPPYEVFGLGTGAVLVLPVGRAPVREDGVVVDILRGSVGELEQTEPVFAILPMVLGSGVPIRRFARDIAHNGGDLRRVET